MSYVNHGLQKDKHIEGKKAHKSKGLKTFFARESSFGIKTDKSPNCSERLPPPFDFLWNASVKTKKPKCNRGPSTRADAAMLVLKHLYDCIYSRAGIFSNALSLSNLGLEGKRSPTSYFLYSKAILLQHWHASGKQLFRVLRGRELFSGQEGKWVFTLGGRKASDLSSENLLLQSFQRTKTERIVIRTAFLSVLNSKDT